MAIQILLVEDDKAKSLLVRRELERQADGGVSLEILEVDNCIEAKRLLARHTFDLCILDLNLPIRAGDTVRKNAGSDLLNEIHDMENVYNLPKHVVGLTRYGEELDKAKILFTNYMFTVLHFDESKNEWRDSLKHLLKRVYGHSSSSNNKVPDNVVCVVTAVASVELKAMLDIPWVWEEFTVDGDATYYYRAKVTSKAGQSWTVISAAADHAGMPSSIPLAMKMISHFCPKYISMTGITGGKKGEVNIGDVIIADPCWDWGSGKYTVNENNEKVFKPEPCQIPLSTDLRQKFHKLLRDSNLQKEVRAGWSRGTPQGAFTPHIGPHASGAAVLADADLFSRIENTNRKIIGVEMEAYGIFTAAANCCEPRPLPFVLKSVSDYADPSKDDDFQAYAAYTSAAVFKYFVEGYL